MATASTQINLTPSYNRITINAIEEARHISRDPEVKGYVNMAELKAALDS